MASRNFNRKQALEKEVKELYATVSIGATGAPTLTSKVGIASIVRNNQGDYTITLQDSYISLKHFSVSFIDSTPQDLIVQLHSEAVLASKTIRFLTLTDATATDPASGKILLIKIDVKNTTAI